MSIVWMLLYLVPNQIDLGQRHTVPFLFGEQYIPFIGWSLVIYLSVFVQIMVGTWLVLKKDFGLATLGVAVIIAMHAIAFVTYPTCYPRAPVQFTPTWLTWLYDLLVVSDQPNNCLPSLHVSLALFASAVLYRREKILGAWFLVWGIAICVSTLTVKQHYLLDSILGAIVAATIYIAAYHQWPFMVKK
ncbi:MAG: phosphatase PAP2 family protein [Patescibacteria group bacterium]